MKLCGVMSVYIECDTLLYNTKQNKTKQNKKKQFIVVGRFVVEDLYFIKFEII